MSLVSRRNVLGVCVGLLLFGFLNDFALAWQFGAATPATKPARNNSRDATATLEKRTAQEKEGRELFVRDWSRPESKPATGGDGLGPMYNAVSCVACHEQGGTGGGGDGRKNVRLLHMVAISGAPLRTTAAGEAIQKTRLQVHPEMAGVTSVVLHRHQFKDGSDLDDYQQWLGHRLPRHLVDRHTLRPLNPEVQMASAASRSRNALEEASNLYRVEGLPVRMTERNTTSLFGAGLIDSIADFAIVEQAERQKKHHAPLITGRVATDSNGRIGRFGWRGQGFSLQEFVMTACSVELGLNVPNHSQTQPVVGREKLLDGVAINGQQVGAPKLDLTQEQCNSLTVYVAGLPVPQIARSASLTQAKSVQRGSVLFEKLGCVVCHVSDVGGVTGLFSDLLLHDMGPNLSDPLPAIPELDEHITPGHSGSAYGQSFRIELVKNITTNIHQEWRTPPLWGVGSSAPYLHDGRAATLEQAIQAHGGEGQRAAEEFRALKPNERTELTNFLRSLAAPGDGPVMMPRVGGGAAGGGGVGGGGGGFF